MQRPTPVAVDTNILLRLAGEDDATIDAWQLLQQRLKPAQFLVPPTVLNELGAQVVKGDAPLALKALKELRGRWGFFPRRRS